MKIKVIYLMIQFKINIFERFKFEIFFKFNIFIIKAIDKTQLLNKTNVCYF